MAILQQMIHLEGSKGQSESVALFDSGASYSCIQPSIAEKLGNTESLPRPMSFGTAKDGEMLTANQRISLDFYIDGHRLSDEFVLIPGLSEQVIIGGATLQKWRIKLDFENDRVVVDPRVTHLRLL
jgi:predicted aspartyl protease